MKLYYSKGACSLSVRITIHEIGIPTEFEAVDLKTKKTETGEDFLKINPKGAVPVLQLDSKELLTENSAIHVYLADITKADKLLPPLGDFKRYRVLEWLGFVTSDIHKGFSPLFHPKIPDDIKKEIIIPNLKNKFNFVDQHLSQNTFLMGDHFTIVDSYLFVMITWLKSFKIEIPKHALRYFEELSGRPCIQQSLKEEGITNS